jgi:hypothetical protein
MMILSLARIQEETTPIKFIPGMCFTKEQMKEAHGLKSRGPNIQDRVIRNHPIFSLEKVFFSTRL